MALGKCFIWCCSASARAVCMCAFGKQSCSSYQENCRCYQRMFLSNCWLISRGLVQRSFPEHHCGSDGENTAKGERLKGEGSVFIVHPHPHFSILRGYRGGTGLKKIFRIFIKLWVSYSLQPASPYNSATAFSKDLLFSLVLVVLKMNNISVQQQNQV